MPTRSSPGRRSVIVVVMGRVAESSTVIAAIETVAKAVRRAREAKDPARSERMIAAVENVASVTRTHGQATVEYGLAKITAEMLAPVDPSSIGWNAFRAFEVESSETAWTKWIAALLSPENGAALSRLAWRSVCDAVLAQRYNPEACVEEERDVLADAAAWRHAREQTLVGGSVEREVADENLGRPDIVIDAPGLFVVLENKLDANWHDGDEPQPVKYRQFGLKHRAAGQRLGLVLLAKREELELEAHCADYVRILYRDVARALRHNLRQALAADASPPALLVLWPALITVAAIEHELLGIDIQRSVAAARLCSWRAMSKLNHILSYLHEEHE